MKHKRWLAIGGGLVWLCWMVSGAAWAQFGDPDLVVEAITLDPAQPRAGQPVEIQVAVKNAESNTVRDRFEVLIRLDGATLSNARVFQLGPFQTQTVVASWDAAEEGEHTVSVEIDRRNAIQERNERNNEARLTFTVAADARVESFTRTALSVQGAAWDKTGLALLPTVPSGNLFGQLAALQDGFATTAEQMRFVQNTLATLRDALPADLRADAHFAALVEPYKVIGEAAAAAKDGLDALDLGAAITAMGTVETGLRALAAEGERFPALADLAEAAGTLSAAIAAAGRAEEAFSGSDTGAQEDALDALFGAVELFSTQLLTVSEALFQAADETGTRFLDPEGEPLEALPRVAEVTVAAPAPGLRFTVLTPSGETVATLETSEAALAWEPADDEGDPLEPGTYFYRARWGSGASSALDLGRFTLVAE